MAWMFQIAARTDWCTIPLPERLREIRAGKSLRPRHYLKHNREEDMRRTLFASTVLLALAGVSLAQRTDRKSAPVKTTNFDEQKCKAIREPVNAGS
jgi:hypothetical protein